MAERLLPEERGGDGGRSERGGRSDRHGGQRPGARPSQPRRRRRGDVRRPREPGRDVRGVGAGGDADRRIDRRPSAGATEVAGPSTSRPPPSGASTVVVLAAGLGTRFGGLKQLAPVGPNGQAILDFLVRRAAAAGFADAIVIVRPDINDAITAHVDEFAPPIPVRFVTQTPVPGRERPLGTAHAVLACADAVEGPIAVVNADDLYPAEAFDLLA